MKRKNILKAGILLTILMLLMLVLPVSAAPAQQTLTITVPNVFGIGIKAIIKNIGTTTATNVDWTISASVAGGWVFPPSKSGTIASIAPAGSVTVKAIFFGLSNTATFTVTATYATPVTAQQTKILLIFIW